MQEVPRVLLTRRLQGHIIADLKSSFRLETHTRDAPITRKELIAKIADKEGILCLPYDTIDAEVIDAAPNLRAISTYSVGYDHIDVQYAKKCRITVGYTPDVLTRATADLAFVLMLDLMRKVSEGDRLVRAGRWRNMLGPCEFLGVDPEGKTVGILGPGRIGLSFASRAKAFGMRIIYHGRRKMSKETESRLDAQFVSLNQLFARSDAVSIHMPYTSETHRMVGYSLLKKMKPGAFIINTARGRVINQEDLVRALREGKIAGAALDVFYDEPLRASNPLASMENVLLVPHIGSATLETRESMSRLAVLNLKLALSGKSPRHAV